MINVSKYLQLPQNLLQIVPGLIHLGYFFDSDNIFRSFINCSTNSSIPATVNIFPDPVSVRDPKLVFTYDFGHKLVWVAV